MKETTAQYSSGSATFESPIWSDHFRVNLITLNSQHQQTTVLICWWWQFVFVTVALNINMQWIQAQLNMYVAIGMHLWKHVWQIPIKLKHFGMVWNKYQSWIILCFKFWVNYDLLILLYVDYICWGNMIEYSLDSLMQLLQCIMIHATVMGNTDTNTEIRIRNNKMNELYCYCASCLLVLFCLFVLFVLSGRVFQSCYHCTKFEQCLLFILCEYYITMLITHNVTLFCTLLPVMHCYLQSKLILLVCASYTSQSKAYNATSNHRHCNSQNSNNILHHISWVSLILHRYLSNIGSIHVHQDQNETNNT